VDGLCRVRRRIRPRELASQSHGVWRGNRIILANRKEPFSGYQRGRLAQKREGIKSALLKCKKESRLKWKPCSWREFSLPFFQAVNTGFHNLLSL
jgi:hypothetical protein